MVPFDLHVLSIPPAFILSQDQTLRFVTYEYYDLYALALHDPSVFFVDEDLLCFLAFKL